MYNHRVYIYCTRQKVMTDHTKIGDASDMFDACSLCLTRLPAPFEPDS